MGYVRIAGSKLNEFDQKDDFFEKNVLTIRERFVIFLSETVIITVKETRQTNVIKFIKEKEITIMAKYVCSVCGYVHEEIGRAHV